MDGANVDAATAERATAAKFGAPSIGESWSVNY
jgi:hypothetical protein